MADHCTWVVGSAGACWPLAIRAGRMVPVEALVDAMWGDDPPPTAAKTVQSHVVRLRQSLNDAGDPIETTPGGYRLRIERRTPTSCASSASPTTAERDSG